MAKAIYHKNQRVYVKPVGTWALIERVVPQWAKGVEEPLRVTYDCGLGREFGAEELETEIVTMTKEVITTNENWRVMRGTNKWRSAEECAHHPYPGTFPIVVTSEQDWGGWRVPGAEYDLDPHQIEAQARMIAATPVLVTMLQQIVDIAEDSMENVSNQLFDMIQQANELLRNIEEGYTTSGDDYSQNEMQETGTEPPHRSPETVAW